MRSWLWTWRRIRRSPDDEWGLPAASPFFTDSAPGASPPRGSLRRFHRGTRFGLGPRLMIILLLSVVTATYTLYQIDRRFRPALGAIAEMKAKAVASQAINEALAAEDVFGNIRYDQLMDVKMDPEGKRVLLLQANGPELSRIAGRAQRQVWQRLTLLDGQSIDVPVAQVLGWTLFTRWGPRLHLTFEPTGATVTDVRQLFQSAGINQTQHVIYAHTEVTIRVLVPLVTKDVVVETNTFITAAVLNGEVPSFYMNGGTILPAGQTSPSAVAPGGVLSPGVGFTPGVPSSTAPVGTGGEGTSPQ